VQLYILRAYKDPTTKTIISAGFRYGNNNNNNNKK
jgi:hypothetical protein